MIEALGDIAKSLFVDGISWGSIIVFLVALSKFQKANRYKEWNENQTRNQEIIIKNQEAQLHNDKIIMNHIGEGGRWRGAVERKTFINSTQRLKLLYIQTTKYLVRIATLFIHRKEIDKYKLRRKKIMERLKSRKLWIALVSAVLLVLKEGFDIQVDSEVVLGFAGIVISAILGFAHVDAKKELKDNAPNISTSEFEG